MNMETMKTAGVVPGAKHVPTTSTTVMDGPLPHLRR
jgi:hypothetical protein